MTDRFLTRAWWFAVMALIGLTACSTMLTAYCGVFSTFAGQLLDGATWLLASFPLGGACYLLCRHRSDLVCD